MTKTTKASTKSTKTAPKNKAGEKGVCLVTGVPTSRPSARFAPGMDARLKSMLLKAYRGETSLTSVPKAALNALREAGSDGLVGFVLKGDKLTHTGNFKIADKSNTGKAKAKKELNSKAAFTGKKATAGAATKTAKKNKAARKARIAALASSAGIEG